MATQTTAKTIDTTPLWEVLRDLPFGDIPEDLTEIDGEWCYSMLCDYCAGELWELASELTRSELDLLAFDLRDQWHTAICERMEWDRSGAYDYS